jgi:hypothetical protein
MFTVTEHLSYGNIYFMIPGRGPSSLPLIRHQAARTHHHTRQGNTPGMHSQALVQHKQLVLFTTVGYLEALSVA